MTHHQLLGVTLALASAACTTNRAQTAPVPATPPTSTYWVYVANESSDLVSLVRFGPGGAVEEKTISVGIKPVDLAAGEVTASTEVRLQPGGIGFWKMESGQEPSGR